LSSLLLLYFVDFFLFCIFCWIFTFIHFRCVCYWKCICSSNLVNLSNVRFSTASNFRRSSVDLHPSTTWSRIMSSFWSTVYSHETESFESLTMKLALVSSSFCFAWRNTCLSNDMCFLGLK
jgi:hypothetical protein